MQLVQDRQVLQSLLSCQHDKMASPYSWWAANPSSIIKEASEQMDRGCYEEAYSRMQEFVMSTDLGNVLARMAECAFKLERFDDVPVLATASKVWSTANSVVHYHGLSLLRSGRSGDAYLLLREAKISNTADTRISDALCQACSEIGTHTPYRERCVWQYQNGYGDWTDMGGQLGQLGVSLEAAYLSRPQTLRVVDGHREFDLGTCQECNLKTGRKRNLRRVSWTKSGQHHLITKLLREMFAECKEAVAKAPSV